MFLAKIKQSYQSKPVTARAKVLIGVLIVTACLVAVPTKSVNAAQPHSAITAGIVADATDVPVVKSYDQQDVDNNTNDQCGGPDENPVKMSIDIGCKGLGNPILDAVFAVIRFMTIGVGIVVIGSTIYAGIQFTTSRGDPNATGQAMKRISSNVAALVLFILTYSILNWLVPGTILK